VHAALAATAHLWPPVRRGYRGFHRAAAILKNETGLAGRPVRRRLDGLLGAVRRHRPDDDGGKPAGATAHFLKVTASDRPGLFHCYDVPGLPRTNNDLGHLFGSNRDHERRATGRRAASPAMVLRGPVRLVAATATRAGVPPRPHELAPADVHAWRQLRRELDERRAARTSRRRFRRDPQAYLRQVEEELLKSALPS